MLVITKLVRAYNPYYAICPVCQIQYKVLKLGKNNDFSNFSVKQPDCQCSLECIWLAVLEKSIFYIMKLHKLIKVGAFLLSENIHRCNI